MSRSKNLRILTGRISFFKVRENRGKIEFKLTPTSEWERCIDKTERTVKILEESRYSVGSRINTSWYGWSFSDTVERKYEDCRPSEKCCVSR